MSHLDPNAIRTLFSRAMSALYRDEVPAYGTLLDLVRKVNDATLQAKPAERVRLEKLGELTTMRRLFAVMGMYPVGYYDLSVAGVPVHSTAFRPLDDAALNANPFRGDCQLVFAYLRGARPLPVRRSFRQHSLSRGRKHRSWRGGMRWRRVDSVVGEKRC